MSVVTNTFEPVSSIKNRNELAEKEKREQEEREYQNNLAQVAEDVRKHNAEKENLEIRKTKLKAQIKELEYKSGLNDLRKQYNELENIKLCIKTSCKHTKHTKGTTVYWLEDDFGTTTYTCNDCGFEFDDNSKTYYDLMECGKKEKREQEEREYQNNLAQVAEDVRKHNAEKENLEIRKTELKSQIKELEYKSGLDDLRNQYCELEYIKLCIKTSCKHTKHTKGTTVYWLEDDFGTTTYTCNDCGFEFDDNSATYYNVVNC